MNINGVNPNFCGKYQLNANQNMTNQDACLKRDAFIGFWSQYAKNGEQVKQQLHDFYKGEYNQNPNAPCNITLDLPDSYGTEFEKSMNSLGQKFDKLA